MTSLSTQLRNLQIPDTFSVLSHRNKRASLLFEAHEAADIDIDTVFSLGRTGLSDLQDIDNDFEKFEKTLFSENVKTMERTQQPKEFNQRLDKKIKEFLTYLSPYFLIKPAQKTLEWLIRRFQINVFNVDDLICCALPFHETNLFARVLDTIVLNKQTEKWEWLSQTKKSGYPLPKSIVIQHCLSDSAFLTFVCQMLPQAIEIKKKASLEKLKTLCSFHTGVLLGVAESSKNLTESRIGKILPFLYQGLKSEMTEYKASSYMLLTQICTLKTFKDQVISSLVDQICKSLSGETATFGILALECIYRNQKVKVLSPRSLKIICCSQDIMGIIGDLANDNGLNSFQPVLLTSLLHCSLISTQSREATTHCDVDYGEISKRFLQQMALAPTGARYVLRELCDQYMKLKEVATDKRSLLQTAQKFVQIFEKRYPTETDLVLQAFTTQFKNDEEAQWLQELLLTGHNAAKYKVLPGAETPLFLSLNHPDPERRKLAVHELLRILSSEVEDMEGHKFARTSLLQRLDDDDNSVVDEVLKGGKILLQVIGTDALIDFFEKKLNSKVHFDRLSLAKRILTIFKDFNFSDGLDKKANSFMLEVIQVLLPSKPKIRKQLSAWKLLVDSSFGSSNLFFEAFHQVFKNIDLDNFASSVSLHDTTQKIWLELFDTSADMLAANISEDTLITASLEFAVSADCNSSFNFFFGGVLLHLLDKVDRDHLMSLFAKMEHFMQCNVQKATVLEGKSYLLKVFQKSNDTNECLEKTLHKILVRKQESSTDMDPFPGSTLFCILLRKVIHKISPPQQAEGNVSLDAQTFLFELLACASGRKLHKRPFIAVFRFLMQEFLEVNFPSSKELLAFLSSMFMKPEAFYFLTNGSGSNWEKIDVHICALHLFKVCSETLCNSFISLESEVLPTLLVLLFHPLQIIREAAIGCIQSLHGNSVVKNESALQHLLDCLVDNDTELVEDRHEICNVLERLFKQLSTTDEGVEISEPKHVEDLRLVAKYLSGFIIRSDINLKLGIATITASVNCQDYLVYIMPMIEDLIKNAQITGLNSLEMKLLSILMKKFNTENVNVFDKIPASLIAFRHALQLGNISIGSDSSIQHQCIEQVTTRFYENIASRETKREVFGGLLEASLNSTSSVTIKLVREKLRELPIDSCDIATRLSSLTEEPGVSQPKRAKRTRKATKSVVHQDGLELTETPKWRETLLLLEVIQLKTNLVFDETLILAVFDLLAFCLGLNASNQPSIEYMKQLLLSSLRTSVDEILKSSQKDVTTQEKFRIEKVIECFRASENPQTHQQALLLLGRAASLFPDLVLHNVMSIFTFMGANVLRQDDSYSFEIIKKTIDAVVPTLVSAGTVEDGASTKSGPNKDDIVKLVVRVFVDAAPYIPEHRRMVLFCHFATVLGALSYLHIIIAILLEKMLVQMDHGEEHTQETADGSSLSHTFPFVLMGNFSLQEQATTITKLVEFLAGLPDEKQEESHVKRVTRSIRAKNTHESLVPLFDATKFSTKEIRQYKYRTLDFVSKLLSERDFTEKASAAGTASMDNLYYHLLYQVLEYLCTVGKRAEEDENQASIKYYKIQQQKGGEILNKVCRVLTFDAFFNVTCQLMKSENSLIRKKVVELIGQKIISPHKIGKDEMEKLSLIAKQLIDLVKVDSSEVPTNKHTALQVLRPLLSVLSKSQRNDITDAAGIFIDIVASSGVQKAIIASALLCIGELVLTLNVHMIQFLPHLMPSLIKLLTDETNGQDIVVLNTLGTLQRIIASLSKFMSPYIVSILEILTSTQFDYSSVRTSSIGVQIKAKTVLLRGEVSQKIIPRVLLPALDACFDTIAYSKKHSILALMEVVKESIETMSHDDIKANHIRILAMLLKAFDIRCLYSEKPEKEVDIAEDSIIVAFCGLVMKMSENTFRPMFLKIFNWSTSAEEKSTRLITFYHFCGAVADKLKGLFLLFAGHILKPSAELITKCHTKNDGGIQLFGTGHENKTNLLLSYIFDCLQKCFLHDSQGFLNKERFEYLMSPLVDQLDNDLGGPNQYNERVLNHLNPCLAYLAIAVNDESCWKTLNYQILLKTRNQASQVRFAALRLLEEIHKHIGESYLILLPETIPFLAELMEDESFEVEKQCQHVISHMEEILGESLQKYF